MPPQLASASQRKFTAASTIKAGCIGRDRASNQRPTRLKHGQAPRISRCRVCERIWVPRVSLLRPGMPQNKSQLPDGPGLSQSQSGSLIAKYTAGAPPAPLLGPGIIPPPSPVVFRGAKDLRWPILSKSIDCVLHPSGVSSQEGGRAHRQHPQSVLANARQARIGSGSKRHRQAPTGTSFPAEAGRASVFRLGRASVCRDHVPLLPKKQFRIYMC